MPKISVLMPIYNTREDHLREALESILNQTYGDFEFILLDESDKLAQSVEDIILSYNDERIKHCKFDQRKGLIASLNYGIEIAQGDYIARMDADDVSLPQRFEKQLAFMEENPDVDILGSWIEDFPKKSVIELPVDNEKIVNYLLFVNCAVAHPSVFMRKTSVEKLNIRYNPDEKHAEDYGLWLSLINKAKFANLPEVLLKRRIHTEQTSTLDAEKVNRKALRLRLEAQGKILGIDKKEELEIAEKILCGQNITIKEMKILTDGLSFGLDKIIEYQDGFKYVKQTYKKIIKYTKKTPALIFVFWTHPINKKLKVRCIFKIKTLLGR